VAASDWGMKRYLNMQHLLSQELQQLVDQPTAG
jgi:hypothetical protein